MKNLSPEQMAENLAKFYSLVDKYISGDRKDKLLDMYKSIEETLVISPASTRLSFHNAFPGGYLDHVLRVTEAALIFEKVWDKFGQDKNYSTEELAFSALNHDLGKLGTNDKPVYIPNQSQWHKDNQGLMYNYNPELTHMRIADRSLYVLQSHGIQVSENEYLGIKLHDGLYEEANKQYYITYGKDTELRSNIAYILHQADLMSSKIESQQK